MTSDRALRDMEHRMPPNRWSDLLDEARQRGLLQGLDEANSP